MMEQTIERREYIFPFQISMPTMLTLYEFRMIEHSRVVFPHADFHFNIYWLLETLSLPQLEILMTFPALMRLGREERMASLLLS